MSLRVWLPLSGDLHNQGLSTVTASSGTAAYGAGKIGAKGLDLINSTQINLFCDKLANATTFSICCWIKGSKDTSDSDWVSPIRFGVKKSSTAENYDFRFGKHDNASGTEGYPVGVYHNSNNTISSTNNAFTTAEDWGKWVHICFIYDGTNIKGYKNGIQVFSHTSGQGGYLTGNFRLRVGRCNWLVNDLRIYDNCLSAAEVREIAQGLVLHYKLDRFQGGYGNPNIIVTHSNAGVDGTGTSGWSAAGTGWSNSFVSATGATGGYAIRCTYANTSQTSGGIHHPTGIDKTTLTTGDIYTLSARIRTSKACVVTFQNELMTTGHSINATTEWQTYTYTCAIDTSKTYQSNVMYVRAADAVQNMWIECDWIKLEKGTAATPWQPSSVIGTAIQDSSGYNHNGTTVGNILIQPDSARYNTCVKYSTNSELIFIGPCFSNDQTLNAITVNCWFKTNTTNSTAPNIFCLGKNSFLRSRIASATSIWSYYRVGSTQMGETNSCKTLTDNIWHMLTFRFDKGKERIFIDGEPIGTEQDRSATATYLTCASQDWYLGGLNESAEKFIGSLSDFRIYCTPLLDTDIKQLYNVGMKVDKGQNIHAFEFNEQKEKNSLSKQGQLFSKEFEENVKASLYKTNIIEANEFIER